MNNRTMHRLLCLCLTLAVLCGWQTCPSTFAQPGLGSSGGGAGEMSPISTERLQFRIRTIGAGGQPVKLLAVADMSIVRQIEFYLPDVQIFGFYPFDEMEGGMGMPGMAGYGGDSMGGMMPGMGMESMGMGGMYSPDGMGMGGGLDLSKMFNEQEVELLNERVRGLVQIHWCSQQFGRQSDQHPPFVMDQYRKKLAELLQVEYKARLNDKEKELKNLEAQVANLRQDLVRRQQATSDVVAFEVQRRVLGAQGLEMNADELSPYRDDLYGEYGGEGGMMSSGYGGGGFGGMPGGVAGTSGAGSNPRGATTSGQKAKPKR